jgi:hypothetical protein
MLLCMSSLAGMAVLIDPPRWPAHGRRWSHLVSDASFAELHRFAAAIGVPSRGFEGDHYDLPEDRYAAAIAAGAIPVSTRELLRRLQVSGLRRQKRRGEKVVASRSLPGTGIRVDALTSTLPPTGPVGGVVLLAARERDVLALTEGDGLVLPRADRPSGATVQEVAATLVTRFLGSGWAASGTGAQVGYLRMAVAPSWRATRFEAVIRWTVPRGMPSFEPDHPARWWGAGEVAALLPVELAALVRAVRS